MLCVGEEGMEVTTGAMKRERERQEEESRRLRIYMCLYQIEGSRLVPPLRATERAIESDRVIDRVSSCLNLGPDHEDKGKTREWIGSGTWKTSKTRARRKE